MNNEPHWLIVAVLGAFIGFLLPYALRIIKALLDRLKAFHLEGLWHEYHWSYFENSPKIIKTVWKIKKGLLHKHVIRQEYLDKTLEYKGYLQFERGQIIVFLHSTRHDELSFFRMSYPIPSNDKLLTGVWLSYDHDIKIASGGVILSQEELSDEKVEEMMKNKFRIESSIPLIQVT